jgi:nucleoside-diphosphate-sugar epimerase
MERAVSHLLCFGFGFSARTLSARLKALGWKISATSRTPEGIVKISDSGGTGCLFNGRFEIPKDVSHVLLSAPPGDDGDPVLQLFADQLKAHARQFDWIGYLSTTGVYGDRGGDWVDEGSPLEPSTTRGQRRLAAEQDWLKLHGDDGLPVHLFRLAGIYGPGSNQLITVKNGTAKRIIKPGQIFSRIHVEDIAGVLESSMARPNPGRAYNVCDDEPCPPQDVVAYAAALLGMPLPPEIPYEGAAVSPMARSFYAESKRVSNARIKNELGYRLIYPNYRAGLVALLATL